MQEKGQNMRGKKDTQAGQAATAKWRDTVTNKYGDPSTFMKEVGRLGGLVKNPNKGFGSNRKLASEAGRKGGAISKRGRASDYL